jgi:hypothetical protein
LRTSKAEFYLKSAAGGGSEQPVFLADAQIAVRAANPVATDWIESHSSCRRQL